MASPYVISYDLRKVRNYDGLLNTLREWGCISPLESVWLGYLNGTATTIRDALCVHMDADDGLMVIQLRPGSEWGTRGVKESAPEWFRKYVSP